MNNQLVRQIELLRQWRRADADVHRIMFTSLRDGRSASSLELSRRCHAHALASGKRVTILKRLGCVPAPAQLRPAASAPQAG